MEENQTPIDDVRPVQDGGAWQAQQDYAWGWFQYHAKQRTDMFNYFLVATGLLVNAFVGLPKGAHASTVSSVALFGCLTSLAFLLLDCRNKQLIDKSVPVLRVIEETWMFARPPFRHLELVERPSDRQLFLTHHSFVFRTLQALLAVIWFALFIHPFLTPRPHPGAGRAGPAAPVRSPGGPVKGWAPMGHV